MWCSHVVFFTNRLAQQLAFYGDKLGSEMSDCYPDLGAFMRCAPHSAHRALFLLALPDGKVGLNHFAFVVRGSHAIFGGGFHINRLGWTTQLGLGCHPVPSAYCWYFRNPAGGLIEDYADEDQLRPQWQPPDFKLGATGISRTCGHWRPRSVRPQAKGRKTARGALQDRAEGVTP